MRVSKNSEVPNIAGTLAGAMRSGDETNIDVIGHEAVYLAVKSIILAGKFVEPEGIKLSVEIGTKDVKVSDGNDRTVIVFKVSPRFV